MAQIIFKTKLLVYTTMTNEIICSNLQTFPDFSLTLNMNLEILLT